MFCALSTIYLRERLVETELALGSLTLWNSERCVIIAGDGRGARSAVLRDADMYAVGDLRYPEHAILGSRLFASARPGAAQSRLGPSVFRSAAPSRLLRA